MKKSNFLDWISLVVCLTGLTFTLIVGTQNRNDPAKSGTQFIKKKFGTFMIKDTVKLLTERDPSLVTTAADDEAIRKLAGELYDNRKTAYESTTQSLTSTLDFLLVMTIIGLFVLFFKPKELEIPVVKIALPDKLLYIVIPMAILFLWLQLGLKMNAGLDSRLILETMADSRETIGYQRVSYYHSDARTLVDQGLIDSWCTWYYDIFEGGRQGGQHSGNARFVLFGFFGTFWGLVIGTSLSLISAYYDEYRNRIMSALLLLGAVTVFLGWTRGTVSWYEHSGYLCAWMWGVALVAVLLWILPGKTYAERIAAKREEKKKAAESEGEVTLTD